MRETTQSEDKRSGRNVVSLQVHGEDHGEAGCPPAA